MKLETGRAALRHSVAKINVVKITVIAALIGCLHPAMARAESVRLSRTTAAGVPVVVIAVDLNNPDVKVTGVVAEGGCGSAESLERMIWRTHPTAAVTGTYFDVGSSIPVGDLVVDGHLVHRGGVGTGFCIDNNNECSFVHPPHRYARMDWSAYDFVCCSGPRLVHRGRAEVHPGAEGFRDKHMLERNTRLAVGLTKNKKLIFVATRKRIQLGELAKALKKLGCVEAINLDAGSSLGFYDKGKMIIRPQRKLTNAILIYDNPHQYERFKSRLTPQPRIMAKR